VYLAADHVTGIPLADLLSGRSLTPADRGQLVAQLTEAVAAAHRAGVLHLQLGPSAVRISRTNGSRASIVGFGMRTIADGATGTPDDDLVALQALIRQLD
jgi:serine/threonine-protein kinase